MRNASIDIGSNSILLYIAESNDGKTIKETGEITKLGESLADTGLLGKNEMEHSLEVLKKFKDICDENGVNKIFAAGTMALRNAANSSEFIERVKEETGLEVEIISGEEEAKHTFTAAKSVIKNENENVLVVDIGGGSTEFIFGKGKEILHSESINLGVLKVSENYFKNDVADSENVNKANDFIRNELKKISVRDFTSMVGVGGSITNLASVKLEMDKFDASEINGLKLNDYDIEFQISSYYLSKTLKERENIKGLQKGRAPTILAGALISLNILKRFNYNYFIVSTYGLRHGLLINKLMGK